MWAGPIVRRTARAVAVAAALAASFATACDRGGGTPAASPPAAQPPAPKPPALGPKVFPMDAAPALDDPYRDEWQRPVEVLAALRIRPGQRVADVGCGTGYFTLHLLGAVGRGGRVIAVDIQQPMLDLLATRLRDDERRIITLRCTPPDRPLEPGDALDLVLCANTLHEVDDADAPRFVQSMADALAPGGRLALVNWLPTPMMLGPPQANRIAPDRVRKLAEAAGLTLSEDLALLPTHSFLVYVKPR